MEAETILDSKSLKVLGVGTRQDILKELKERPHTASELSRHLNKHITTIKEHIDLLMEAGLVDRRERKGRKWVYYSLSRKGEKLFKTSYNWVVILGLSVACIFSGIFTLPGPAQQFRKSLTAVEEVARAGAGAGTASVDVSVLLVVAGIAGISYVLYKKLR